MSDTLFHTTIHYSAPVSEPEARQRVEEALSIACVYLDKFRDSEYIGCKIRELVSLD